MVIASGYTYVEVGYLTLKYRSCGKMDKFWVKREHSSVKGSETYGTSVETF